MKKKFTLILLTLVCVIACAFGFTACDGFGDQLNKWLNGGGENGDTQKPSEDALVTAGLQYTLNDDNVSYAVTGLGSVTNTQIYIASEYNGKPVTRIEERAFQYCGGLTSVTIPNSVTRIGAGAFEGCSSLESITLPFVGDSIKTERDPWQYPLGYIFGTNSYTGGVATEQFYLGSSTDENDPISTVYYIPSSLKSVTVTGGNILVGAFYACGGLTSITIPSDITKIGIAAFFDCRSLMNVTIPNSVTSIGGVAFSGCSGFKSIEIPNKLTNVDDFLFENCTGLTSVEIPKNITRIGRGAFRGCSGLTNVMIYNSATSVEFDAFEDCNNLQYTRYENAKYLGNRENPYFILMRVTDETIASFTINANTKAIATCAFGQCSKLKSIAIPNGVEHIGEQAFYNCSSLTSITIPNSVTSIGSSAFNGCSGLTSIMIPNSVTSIGSSAFNGCSKLQYNVYDNAKYLGNSENPYLVLIKATDTSITSCAVNANTKMMDAYAFSGCNKLERITVESGNPKYHSAGNCLIETESKTLMVGCKNSVIPADGSVTSIEDRAFENCSALTSITIPNSVTSIGVEAFSYCSSLTSVTIPSSITSIGSCAFRGCSGLTSITIPESVMWIETGAFWDCGRLTSIMVDLNNRYYDSQDRILYNKAKTQILQVPKGISGAVTIPNSVTSIVGEFSGCSSLTSITIPESVTWIWNIAFSGCSNLESITVASGNTTYHSAGNCIIETESKTLVVGCKNSVIPADGSVTSIGEQAFGYCRSLTSITIPNGVTSIGNLAFSYCSGLTSVTIGNGVTSIGNWAFFYCSGLTSITIPNSVTSIGYDAFADCSNLATVNWNATECTSAGSSSYPIFCNCSNLTTINIGDNVKTIPSYAFYSCSSLTSITIPESVTSIGNSAFYGCSSLTSITIPNSVTSIGYGAFAGCSSLASITIPNSVTSIGRQAFFYCRELTRIDFNGTKAQWKAISEGDYWNDDTGNYTIYCTDGNLDKNGNETA